MTPAPRLGFVVPVYRPPLDVFDPLVRSLRVQTMPDWECILVDDGSDDPELTRVLTALAESDERFRLVVAEQNGGIAAATNLGLAALRSPVFAFVDNDDLVAADAAAALLERFDNDPSIGLVYSDEATIDEAGEIIAPYRKPDYSPIRHAGQHYLNHLMAARTDLIDDLWVRSEFEPTQDSDFVLRVIERAVSNGQRVDHISRDLYGWRAIAGSTAFDAGEKAGVAEAVHRSFSAALERRGIDAEVRPSITADGKVAPSVRIEFPLPPANEVDLIEIDADRDTTSVLAEIAAGGAPFFALVPPSIAVDEGWSSPGEWWRVVASETARAEVGAAGPLVIDRSGVVVSTGRVVVPALRDLFSGSPIDDGPFGANQVAREVSALSPIGAVFDRRAMTASGIDPAAELERAWSDSLDVIVADWGIRLRANDYAVVVTPRSRVVVPATSPSAVGWDDAWDRWVAEFGQPAEPYAPIGAQPPANALQSRARLLERVGQPGISLVVTAAAILGGEPGRLRVAAALAFEGLAPPGQLRDAGQFRDKGDAFVDLEPRSDLDDLWTRLIDSAGGSASRSALDAALVDALRSRLDRHIADAVAAAIAADEPVVLVGCSRSVADALVAAAAGPDAPAQIEWSSDPGPAIDRAIVALEGRAGSTIVVAATVEEHTVIDAARASISGATSDAAGVKLVAVPPWPARDLFDWPALLRSDGVEDGLVDRARDWWFERADEGEVNVQLGATFGPLLADLAARLQRAADELQADRVVCSKRLGPLASMIAIVDADQASVVPIGDIAVDGATEDRSLWLRWDSDDATGFVGDEASGRDGAPAPERTICVVDLIGETPSIEIALLIERLMTEAKDGEPSSGFIDPGLLAARDAAAAFGHLMRSYEPDEERAWSAIQTAWNHPSAVVLDAFVSWWDIRFDGPLPRWVLTDEWWQRFAAGRGEQRVEVLREAAGRVPLPIASRLIEARQTGGSVAAMLATFEQGSDAVASDQRGIPIPGSDGWRTHRLRWAQPSLRAVAFSAGSQAGRVEIASFTIRVGGGGDERSLDVVPLLTTDRAGRGVVVHWRDTVRTGPQEWVQDTDGQIAVELGEHGPELFDGFVPADGVGSPVVEIEVTFRFDPSLEAKDQLAGVLANTASHPTPSWRQRVGSLKRLMGR